jgi:hypothetical protein
VDVSEVVVVAGGGGGGRRGNAAAECLVCASASLPWLIFKDWRFFARF